MECFEELFKASKGQPIEYNQETLFLMDRIPVNTNFKLIFNLISTDSKYPQVIELRVNKGGWLLYGNQQKRQFSFLADSISFNTEIEVTGYAIDGELLVWNAWLLKDHTGVNVKHSWHNGAAMKKVAMGNTIRYFCNDGYPDEDLNDLVFEVTVV